MPDLKATLDDAQTIAVVGCSDRPSRTSYAIARYLQAVSWMNLGTELPYACVVGGPAWGCDADDFTLEFHGWVSELELTLVGVNDVGVIGQIVIETWDGTTITEDIDHPESGWLHPIERPELGIRRVSFVSITDPGSFAVDDISFEFSPLVGQ